MYTTVVYKLSTSARTCTDKQAFLDLSHQHVRPHNSRSPKNQADSTPESGISANQRLKKEVKLFAKGDLWLAVMAFLGLARYANFKPRKKKCWVSIRGLALAGRARAQASGCAKRAQPVACDPTFVRGEGGRKSGSCQGEMVYQRMQCLLDAPKPPKTLCQLQTAPVDSGACCPSLPRAVLDASRNQVW
ncbi:hypothetical protein DL98DRAFT_526376 [Cadophora sp. DSE1049]|nr:hypothetical protein DL98DRAFT_526376 [Cadophora sp. DSE1049]